MLCSVTGHNAYVSNNFKLEKYDNYDAFQLEGRPASRQSCLAVITSPTMPQRANSTQRSADIRRAALKMKSVVMIRLDARQQLARLTETQVSLTAFVVL